MNSLCPLGAKVFPHRKGNCPALEMQDKGYSCGLVSDPEKYAPITVQKHGKETVSGAAMLLVGAGMGCDAKLSGEPYNHAFTYRFRYWQEKNRNFINAAANVWSDYLKR